MVHYQRLYYQQMRKGANFASNFMGGNNHSNNNGLYSSDDDSPTGLSGKCGSYYKKAIVIRPKLFTFMFLSLLCCSLIWAPYLFGYSTLSLLYSLRAENEQVPLCSSVANGTICCDRSALRTDVCYMKGDIRTHSTSASVFLYNENDPRGFNDFGEAWDGTEEEQEFQREKIRPYTRKWETSVMNTIDELSLVSKKSKSKHKCDVTHDVPAVFFSTGGYTGNVYHEFNDGMIPLYITSQQFNKEVVYVILEYHNWWITKYANILSHLTNYPPIDYSGDNRTHCFSEAIVGLNIHDELTIDQSLMKGNKSIRDFRDILDQAYWPRINGLIQDEERERQERMQQLSLSPSSASLLKVERRMERERKALMRKPKLVIMSRNGSRSINNEDMLVTLAEKIGFWVEVLKPNRYSELAKVYRVLNSSDAMIGVHGAAMTHFLFVRPGCVFIQVIPLGTDWAADTYYGQPAVKLGLKYFGYNILPRESSLYNEYDRNDPVLSDPDSVNQRGWQYTKKIYLDNQSMNLDLKRFEKRLVETYDYLVAKRRHVSRSQVL